MATGLVVMYARQMAQSHERPALARDIQHFRRIMMLGAVLTPTQLEQLWTSAAVQAASSAGKSAN
jgi:hypothetical protein